MIEINFLELAVSSTVKLSKVEPNLVSFQQHCSKNQDVNPSCPWQGILSERGPNWFQLQATQCGTQETHLSSDTLVRRSRLAVRDRETETSDPTPPPLFPFLGTRIVAQAILLLSVLRHRWYRWVDATQWVRCKTAGLSLQQAQVSWIHDGPDFVAQKCWNRLRPRVKVAASLVRQGARQLNNSWELSKN